MQVIRETPNLTRVTAWRLVNCYLVAEADGLTLVDTGIYGMAGGLVAAAAGVPIRRIVLTHAHTDHAGSLDGLRRRLPDAEVAVGSREARLLRGDRSTDDGEAGQPGPRVLLPTRRRPPPACWPTATGSARCGRWPPSATRRATWRSWTSGTAP